MIHLLHSEIMKTTIISLCFVLVSAPLFCLAWSQEGHRVAGEIASRHLTLKAKQAVASILGKESIAMASNYADFIKSDTSYKYLNVWHYIDIPDSLSHDNVMAYLQADTAADAYTEIKFLSAQLKKKNLSGDKRKLYLKLLIHMVEDVHQPLHAVETARGGNDIKVSWFGESSNLHRVWDANLIESQLLSYTEYANALDTASVAQIRTLQSRPLSQWLYESYTIAETLTREVNGANEKLGYEYNYNHIDTLNMQLLKAGIDLAKVLNDIFK